jgi:hypothetical protein
MSEPSAAYYEALNATRQLHRETKKFNGRFLHRYVPDLQPLLEELECRTLLDYGCGKGNQWQQALEGGGFLADLLGVRPTLYDPGTERFAAEPTGRFDAVICTQVLGSVPIVDLPWVIDRLLGFAIKLVFVGERVKPVRKQLHAHMADQMPHEKPHDWWAEQLRQRIPAENAPRVVLRTFDTMRGVNRIEDL